MRKLIALVAAGIIAISPMVAFAEEDLEARISALEERVAALEAQIGAPPEGVSPVENNEPGEVGDVETGMVANGCSLSYKRAELGKSYDGKDVVLLYFEFRNESGSTTCADYDFYIKVYQNGRQQESAYVSDNQAYADKSVEFRSGAEPVEVAFASEIMDTSDIIVNISSMKDWSLEDVEFTVSLE